MESKRYADRINIEPEGMDVLPVRIERIFFWACVALLALLQVSLQYGATIGSALQMAAGLAN